MTDKPRRFAPAGGRLSVISDPDSESGHFDSEMGPGGSCRLGSAATLIPRRRPWVPNGAQCVRPGAARATGPGRRGRSESQGDSESALSGQVSLTVTSLPVTVARHGPTRGRPRGRPAGGHRGTSSSGSDSEAGGDSELQVAGQFWIMAILVC
jgi:hypothetical protein